MYLFMMLLACGKNGDSGSCDFDGDIDGIGSDTGNVPALFGSYNTTFATRTFYDECNVEGIGRNDLDWINGAAMQIGGRIDQVDVEFASAPDADLTAIISSQGAVTISGRFLYRGQELHIALGGLLFENTQTNRVEIEGSGFMGMDLDDDGNIDCGVMGDFNAKRSL